MDSQRSKQEAFWHMQIMCRFLSITTPVSLLANEFNVQSVLQGHLSLVAFYHMHVFHEVMNFCKYLKIDKKFALKMYICLFEHI